MSTSKRPKKPASGGERTTPAKTTTRKKKAAAAAPPPPAVRDEADEDEGDEEDDDEEEEAAAAKPAAVSVAKPKPAPAKKGGLPDPDAPAVVPARRLTPEARAKLNELLAKGVSLQDALRKVAQWETFIAPVREPTPPAPHHGPGAKPEGPMRHPKPVHDDEPAEVDAGGDDEPADASDD